MKDNPMMVDPACGSGKTHAVTAENIFNLQNKVSTKQKGKVKNGKITKNNNGK